MRWLISTLFPSRETETLFLRTTVLERRIEILEARLQAIADFEPHVASKNEFAFDRLVDSYRAAARGVLEAANG